MSRTLSHASNHDPNHPGSARGDPRTSRPHRHTASNPIPTSLANAACVSPSPASLFAPLGVIPRPPAYPSNGPNPSNAHHGYREQRSIAALPQRPHRAPLALSNTLRPPLPPRIVMQARHHPTSPTINKSIRAPWHQSNQTIGPSINQRTQARRQPRREPHQTWLTVVNTPQSRRLRPT
jgi:hypothetical protein